MDVISNCADPDFDCVLGLLCQNTPVSILYKPIADRYRPVRVADGPITARYRFLKNTSWDVSGWILLTEIVCFAI